MNIIITGDTHGDVRRFNNDNIKLTCGERYPPKHAIILGDFGVIWANQPSPQELYWLKWLDDKKWDTLVVLGNHCNYERIYLLPTETKYGAPMFKISKKVFAFQHGNVYTLEGKKFFVFGGADSIDKAGRKNRISWWEEEIPTGADIKRGFESLKKVDSKVDYILSHTVPKEAIDVLKAGRNHGMFCGVDLAKYEDPTVKMLDAFNEVLPKDIPWYCGHFHEEADVLGWETNRPYLFMFETIKILKD